MTSPANRLVVPGSVFVLGYAALNAVKSVYEGRLLVELSPAFLAVNVFVLAQVVYLAVNPRKDVLLAKVRRAWRPVAAINVTTALSWFAVLYALDNLPPAVANSLIVGLIPVISLLLQPVLRLRAGRARSDVVSAVGCLLSVFLLIHFTLQAGSGLGALSPTSVAIGVAAAFLMALGVSTNTYVTKMLSESGFSSAETMSVRFTLLNLLAFTLTTAEGGWGSYSPQALLAIVALAVIGVFLGIYLLQIGIARTEPLQVSLLFTTNLTFTYLAQFLDPRIEQTLPVLGCVLLVTSFTAYGTLAARSRDTRPAGSATRPPVQTSSPSNQ